MSEVNTWDRQFNESEEAFSAFYRWRDAGSPRPKLVDFALTVGRHYAVLLRWHREHSWESRALDWDRHVDGRRQEAMLETLDDMHKRHVRFAQRAQKIANKAMDDIEKRIESMSVRDMIRMGDVYVKLERLARGEVTERVESTNYGNLSDADLKVLEELAKKST